MSKFKTPQLDYILNQGKTPTCVCHAVCMAAMLHIYNRTSKWVRLSPYSLHGYFDNSGGGMTVKYAAEALCRWGCLPSTVFTHRGDNPMLHEELEKLLPLANGIAESFRATEFKEVLGFDGIKEAIADGYIVVGAVRVGKSFGKTKGGIEPIYPKNTTDLHAICFFDTAVINGKEYLAAINSHGRQSGDGGKVYIPRGRLICDTVAIKGDYTKIKPKAKQIELYIGSKHFTSCGEGGELDIPPFIKDSRVFLPVRVIAEKLGATVEWDEESGTAKIKSEEGEALISASKSTIEVNGKTKKLDAAPVIIDGRMLCPVRHIAEAFNCKAEWLADKQKAVITAL